MLRSRHLVLGLATALAADACAAQQEPQGRPLRGHGDGEARVLFLTHSQGFTHGVVRRVERGKRALAERALAEAAHNQLVVDATQDCAAIDRENLAHYACVVLYTTGELPIDAAGRTALLDFVRSGGGFVGIHSATDTFYDWPEYGDLIGGYFDGHPWHQEVSVVVEQPDHPAVRHLAPRFAIQDEIYQFKAFARDRVEVLLRLDPDSVDIEKGKRRDRDYALSWCRAFGQGRVFYTALGHRPEVWRDPRYLRHVLAGIRWAMDARGEWALPPRGARVLFDGRDTSRFEREGGGPIGWQVVDGALAIEPGSGSIVTREAYRDFRLHVEFRIPDDVAGRTGQDRGNSGVYLQRRYEVQILDSHGQPPRRNGCGALYGQRAPDVNACRPAGAWQTFDLAFRTARFDDEGKKQHDARITVFHDGVLVHDDVELVGKTGQGRPEGPEPGPILLQDHGHRVEWRNLWILPVR